MIDTLLFVLIVWAYTPSKNNTPIKVKDQTTWGQFIDIEKK